LIQEARGLLTAKGTRSRVVSLPSWELFEEQTQEYRESVIPPHLTARVTVEAAATLGWERYAGLDGVVIGLERFGASAPGGTVMKELGFTAERVADAAQRLVDDHKSAVV
jgi:transketolase